MSDEKQKYNNFKEALGDGKTRTIFIGGLVLVLVIGFVAFLSIRKPAQTGGVNNSEVASLPAVNSPSDAADGKGATHKYDKLVEEENAKSVETAKENGTSAIPAIRTTPSQPEPAQQPAQAQPQPVLPPVPPPNPEAQREEDQKRQKALNDQTQAMKNQVNLLIGSWAPKEHMTFAQKDVQGTAAAGNNGGGQSASGASGNQAQATAIPTKKAGDTCYAELDTAVNTDEPSPVTATIRQCGVLDQAKLIGKVEVAQNSQVAQKAQLRFSSINVPGQATSIAVDAVAIDETTRRTALASDVDNHYFLRYGTLFASAFLSGYGDALIRGGQQEQIVATTAGGAIVQRQAYDAKQLALAGIGNVGKQVSSNMGSVFNRPPTITIDAGIGIGILFMTDLTLK